ncbi:MAG: exodeoxyribonuclease VII large subunit [Treponema sp.]|nr:exodeoxyribonuclease VII large subunit [Treponema sp.]
MGVPEEQLNQVFSVSQITSYIKEILESAFSTIVVEGEISNWRPSSSGHVYFTLKDNTAQLKAVMFKGSLYSLKFKPKDGDKVRCTGRLSVYEPQGNYQLIVNRMEATGAGDILAMLEERKKKLAAEGLFEESRKKPLPQFPRTIGVVTSPTGAAIRDILQVSRRRNKNINVIVFPALVQGDTAAATIVKMIEIANFYKLCDILIVGRGGGSLEDLLPFSDEAVVRAVAESEIPVISAVGHEIDWALCDYSADKRAATPSAAAELAVPLLSDLKQDILDYKTELYNQIKQKIENKRLIVRAFDPSALEMRFRNIQQPLLNRFDNAKQGLHDGFLDKIKDLRTKIVTCRTILENASPQTILNRGYSMVCDENGTVIRDSNQVTVGCELVITPSNGVINAQVIKKE